MTINPEIIVGSHQQDSVRNAIDAGEVVEYSIFADSSVANGLGSELKIGWSESQIIRASNHEYQHADFINSVFERLDPLLDLDFIETDSSGNSDINIYRTYYNSWWDKPESVNIHGPNNGRRGGGGTTHYGSDHIDIAWKDYSTDDSFTDAEKSAIVHEIGQALGLKDLFYDLRWDRWDTIMSDNLANEYGFNTWFTDADIAALQSIWGVEANDNPVLTGSKAVLVNGSEDTQYTFSKSALLHGFTDVDSALLSVSSIKSSAGTLNDNGNGTFTLTPPRDFYGKIFLNYKVSDGMGGSVTVSNSISFDDMPDDGIVRKGTSNRDILKGKKGDDTLIGYGGSDKLLGKKGNDTLIGGSGQDILMGSKGNDYLDGSKGIDTLNGGKGADVFQMSKGLDLVEDFSIKQGDRIALDKTGQYRIINDPDGVLIIASAKNQLFLDGADYADVITAGVDLFVQPV